MILRWFGRKKPEDDTPAAAPDTVGAPPPAEDTAAAKDVVEAFQPAVHPQTPELPEDLPPPPAVETPPPEPIAPSDAESAPEDEDAAQETIQAEEEAEPEPEEPLAPAAAAAVAPTPAAAEEPKKKGWLSRLRDGLSKSSSKLTDGISGIFTKRKLDDEALEELEELLITADLGPVTAAKMTAELARTRFGKEISPDEVKRALAAEVAKIVRPVAQPLTVDAARKPHVILVVGVNGTGKTTTIGKLARQFRDQGHSVMLAAGDTFRAAAVSQLKIWGERTGCAVVAKDTGADAAGLAFEALERARREGVDVLLIDTAGRLQNKAGLMEELKKIVRVIKKLDDTAPHTTLLTLDATTGQNAHNQVEVFRDMVSVGGLILTKLDGSARGGVLVALAEKFKLPVHAIGVGEGVEDLRPFDADQFAQSLMGLETR